MERVLHIIGSLNRAGAETFLINLYRVWNRSIIQFDFALYQHENDEKNYYAEAEQMGGRIYYLPPKSDGMYANILAVKNLVRKNQYKIVWRHTDSCVGGLDLLGAKWGGAERLILHSHNTQATKIGNVLHYLLRPWINGILTERFACGDKAGKWMYGNRDFKIVNNGVDTEKYRYNQIVRDRCRGKLNLSNQVVIGHVGRFSKVKNHEFLLQIVKCMLDDNEDVKLILVGDGKLKEDIEKKAIEFGISKYVQFLGVRDDIEKLMQIFDVFVMPSLFEGFPVTLIEAQAAALPCLVSSVVSKEVKLIDNVEFEKLTESPYTWGKEIMQMSKKERYDSSTMMKEAGYDIKNTAQVLQNLLIVTIHSQINK